MGSSSHDGALVPQRLKADGEARRHFAVEKLSPAGRAIVEAAFAAGVPYDAVVEQLQEETGEKVSRSAVSRYYRSHWKESAARARDLSLQSTQLVDALKIKPTDELTETIRGLLALGLMERSSELASLDPVKALSEQRHREELRLREKELDLKKQEIELGVEQLKQRAKEAEVKIETARVKLARIASQLDGAAKQAGRGKALSPEALKKIREECFGL